MAVPIHLSSSDFDRAGALQDALNDAGLSVSDTCPSEPVFVLTIVDREPWRQAMGLWRDGVVGVLALCTGEVDARPQVVPPQVVVKQWAGISQSVATVQEVLAGLGSAASIPAAPAPAPPPAVSAAVPAAQPPAVSVPTRGPVAEPEPVEATEAIEEADLLEPSDDHDVVEEADLVEGVVSPPSRAEAPPPRSVSVAIQVEDILPEDQEFVRRVFLQVRDVDFRNPPPPPPRNLTGLDKKMEFLRQRVRELERDLARVGHIWSIKQRKVDAVEQIIESKETERAAAVGRYQQVKEQATRASASYRQQLEAFQNRVTQLEGELARNTEAKNGLELQLSNLMSVHDETVKTHKAESQRQEDEKKALVEDFRSKMEVAQTAFNQLRDQSTRSILERDQRLKALDEAHALTQRQLEETLEIVEAREQTIVEKSQTLDERDASIKQLTDSLEATRYELTESSAGLETTRKELESTRKELSAEQTKAEGLQAALEARDQTINQQAAAIEERDIAMNHANEGFQATREALENDLTQLQEELRQAQELAGERQTQIGSCEGQIAQLTARLTELEQELSKRNQQITHAEAEINDRTQELNVLNDELARTQRDREDRVASLKVDLDRATAAQVRAEEATGEKDKTLATFVEEMSRTRSQHDEHLEHLKQAVKTHEAEIERLKAEIESARREFEQLAQESERRKQELARAAEASKGVHQELEEARKKATEFEKQVAERENNLIVAQTAVEAAQHEAYLAKKDAEAMSKRLSELQSASSS